MISRYPVSSPIQNESGKGGNVFFYEENVENMYFVIKNDVQGIDKNAFSW